jgi:hypothetical protein
VRTFGSGDGKMTKRLLTFEQTVLPCMYVNTKEKLYTHYVTENGNYIYIYICVCVCVCVCVCTANIKYGTPTSNSILAQTMEDESQ